MNDNDFLASLKGGKLQPAAATPAPEPQPEPAPQPDPVPSPDPIPSSDPIPDPANPEPVPQPTGIDAYNQRIKETFGYESIDDFFNSDAAAKVKKYDTVSSRLAELEAENGLLYQEFGTATNPFASENSYKVNYLMKEHKLDFNTATSLVKADLGTMNPLEVLLMNERLKEPDMPEKQARLLLAKELGADSWDELVSEDNVEDYKDLIEARAFKAKKELSKYDVSGIQVPETIMPEKVKERMAAIKVEREQAYAKIEETWKPATQYFEANVNELEIPIPTADGKTETYTKVVLKPEDKKKYSEAVLTFCKESGITEMNEQTGAIVNNYLRNMMYLDKLPYYFKIVADKAKSDAILEMQRKKDNPAAGAGAPAQPVKPVDNTVKKGWQDVIPKPKSVFDSQR